MRSAVEVDRSMLSVSSRVISERICMQEYWSGCPSMATLPHGRGAQGFGPPARSRTEMAYLSGSLTLIWKDSRPMGSQFDGLASATPVQLTLAHQPLLSWTLRVIHASILASIVVSVSATAALIASLIDTAMAEFPSIHSFTTSCTSGQGILVPAASAKGMKHVATSKAIVKSHLRPSLAMQAALRHPSSSGLRFDSTFAVCHVFDAIATPAQATAATKAPAPPVSAPMAIIDPTLISDVAIG
mmetsp:Transcript_50481/g.131158  ORF Transcript_50481/g.131158 Transcript_50481/m.131158 type:complete len:243 (+) Transcript_50481:435-1163(+)